MKRFLRGTGRDPIVGCWTPYVSSAARDIPRTSGDDSRRRMDVIDREILATNLRIDDSTAVLTECCSQLEASWRP